MMTTYTELEERDVFERDGGIYRGYSISKLHPSGYFEAYIDGRFVKADTLYAVKCAISEDIKRLAAENDLLERINEEHDLAAFSMFSDVRQCELADVWANEYGLDDGVEYDYLDVLDLINGR